MALNDIALCLSGERREAAVRILHSWSEMMALPAKVPADVVPASPLDWMECPVTKKPCNCHGFCKRLAESSEKAKSE